MAELQVSPLSRKPSGRSTGTKSNWTHNDGHADGHLNCIATRHGWTRTFSLSPDELAALDYAALETILQLPTLKLRSMNTRIFVEHPPGSGVWAKVRFWKDDGSLQSVLVQAFFVERLRTGALTAFEVRDGTERDDTLSIRSGVTGRSGVARVVPGAGQTRDWLKRRGIGRGSAQTDGEPDDDEVPPDAAMVAPPPPPPQAGTKPPKGSRIQAFKFLIGLSAQPPAPPPKTAAQIEQELITEEEVMKKRGWVPPGMRRLQSLKAKGSSTGVRLGGGGGGMFGNASERDFFSRRRRKAPTPAVDAHVDDPFEGDGEAISMADTEPAQAASDPAAADLAEVRVGEEDAPELAAPPTVAQREGAAATAAEQRRWFGLFGAGGPRAADGLAPTPHGDAAQSRTSLATAENPFGDEDKGKGKKKKKDKGKKKVRDEEELTGAERVRVPSDALAPPPVDDEEDAVAKDID